MSRIGKKPTIVPNGVEVTINGRDISVKGPKGTLSLNLHPWATVELKEEEGVKTLVTTVKDPQNVKQNAMWGTMSKLVNNLVVGVTEGFVKKLEVNGVGYKVALSGKNLKLDVGYSHPVEFKLPEGVTAEVEKNLITLTSTDKQLVGEMAAQIRKIRKPEPYKGKGIKYLEEVIRRKAGKAAKSA